MGARLPLGLELADALHGFVGEFAVELFAGFIVGAEIDVPGAAVNDSDGVGLGKGFVAGEGLEGAEDVGGHLFLKPPSGRAQGCLRCAWRRSDGCKGRSSKGR